MPDEGGQPGLFESYAGLEGRGLIKAVLRDYPGKVALVSSFGAESAVLLHMAAEVDRAIPVIFLDTGKLFPETIAYRDLLVDELGLLDVRNVTPHEVELSATDPDGTLHQRDTDLCCFVRKTASLDRAMEGFSVMISGRKRFHGGQRTAMDFVTVQDGLVKVEPLAAFTALDLQAYMVQRQLPSHPLRLMGYRSIGCMPCTVAGGSDDNPRAGRWVGTAKTECGIHFTANGRVFRSERRQDAPA
jgi:phosphoadenosine phosphosulfate reductase